MGAGGAQASRRQSGPAKRACLRAGVIMSPKVGPRCLLILRLILIVGTDGLDGGRAHVEAWEIVGCLVVAATCSPKY